MADQTPCAFTVEPNAAGGAAVTLNVGEIAATVDLPRDQAQAFILALSAAIGDGFARTFKAEAAHA